MCLIPSLFKNSFFLTLVNKKMCKVFFSNCIDQLYENEISKEARSCGRLMLYNVGSTLTPLSSFDSFNIVLIEVLKCLAFSRPNLIIRFFAYLDCEIKIPLYVCFTCNAKKKLISSTLLILNSSLIWLTNSCTLDGGVEINTMSSTYIYAIIIPVSKCMIKRVLLTPSNL